MKQSELDYKQETGLASSRVERIFDFSGSYEYETVPYDEYIEWLEEQYEHYLKCKQSIAISSEVSKYDWDSAVNEIGQLQDQLSDAMDEIRQLSRQ